MKKEESKWVATIYLKDDGNIHFEVNKDLNLHPVAIENIFSICLRRISRDITIYETLNEVNKSKSNKKPHKIHTVSKIVDPKTGKPIA